MRTTTYTPPSTGITLVVRPLNPMFAVAAKNGLPPPPPPPMQRVPTGPDSFVDVENDSDPEYLRALAAHNAKAADLIDRLYIDLSVACEIDTEAVAHMRQVSAEAGLTLEGSDRYLFVAYLACTTVEEWNELVGLITGGGITEAAVDAASATFRGEVPQAADSELAPAPVGGGSLGAI